MRDGTTLDAGTPTGASEASNGGVQEAVADFVGTNAVDGRYPLAALVLAVGWWQAVGAMSAWVAGMGLVVFSFAAPRTLAALSSMRWSTVEGVVVESSLLTEREAREFAGVGSGEAGGDAGYVPLIRYQFSVDGEHFESARVSPFDDTIPRRRWASAVVDQYPRNRRVTLRYDPADPTRSYLRSWVPSSVVLFPVIGTILLAVAVWFAVGFPGGAPVAMTAIGLVAIAAGLSQFRTGFGSRNWPTVDATVTATDISVRGGTEDSSTSYAPDVHYEYEVAGTAYVGSRYSFGGAKDSSFGTRERAREWIADHCPEGGTLSVHYDPDRPEVSVVEPGAWRSLLTVLFGLVFLGGAALFATYGTSVPGL